MSNVTAVDTLVAALRKAYKAAVDRTNAQERDLPDRARDLTARAATLQAENARRAAAGVRVHLAADSFDARHAALLKDRCSWFEAKASARADLASAMTETLLRSIQALEAVAQDLRAQETRTAAAAAAAAPTRPRSGRPGD
jgi:hypothetical protein